MTESTAIEITRRVGRERGQTLDPADIRDTIPQACKAFARSALQPQNAAWRSQLENDYTLAISGTSASFAAEIDLLSDSIIICDHITHPSVLKPGTALLMPFRIFDRVSDLDYAAPISQTLLAFAAVSKVAIEFRYGSALTGNLTARAVRSPKVNGSTFAIDNLPTTLEDLFIETVLALTMKAAA